MVHNRGLSQDFFYDDAIDLYTFANGSLYRALFDADVVRCI